MTNSVDSSVSVFFNLTITAPPPIGSIAGFITDRATGLPVEGALVRAVEQDQVRAADTADAAGHYALIELQTVPHDVWVIAEGYAEIYMQGVEVYDGDTTRLDIALTVACPYIPGNVNGPPPANGLDVVYAVSFFKGGPPPPDRCDMCPQPAPFYAAVDVNGTCTTNGIDITYFVLYLKGGPELMWCPTCPPY
jgi:hypothetical protein